MSKNIHLLWCTYVSRWCTQTHLMQWLCRWRFDRCRSNRLLSHYQLSLVSSSLLLEIDWRSLDSAESDDDDASAGRATRKKWRGEQRKWQVEVYASVNFKWRLCLCSQLQHKVHTNPNIFCQCPFLWHQGYAESSMGHYDGSIHPKTDGKVLTDMKDNTVTVRMNDE